VALQGPLSHIALSASDSAKSIAFYGVFLEALGWRRLQSDHPEFMGPSPRRAAWLIRYAEGASFAIEVRPADPDKSGIAVDRARPGLHHMAFHAESPAAVAEIHAKIVAAGGHVLDAPADYSGRRGYTDGYCAAFYTDPDGLKLEVVYEPMTNPQTG